MGHSSAISSCQWAIAAVNGYVARGSLSAHRPTRVKRTASGRVRGASKLGDQ